MCEHSYMIVKTTHDAYHKMCFKCGDKRVEKIVQEIKPKGLRAIFKKGG